MSKVKNKESIIYWRMTLDYGIWYAKMLDERCDSCIRELKGDAK